MKPPGHLPGIMLKPQATRRHTEDMLERLCHLTDFGKPRTPRGIKEGEGLKSYDYAAASTTLTQISGRKWMDGLKVLNEYCMQITLTTSCISHMLVA